MKNSNDTFGNRTRDLPACSAVPEPTEHQLALKRYPIQQSTELNTKIMPDRQTDCMLHCCVCIYTV
jgi:hypothetical protein